MIPEIARQVPGVTECYRITGEDCYFMKLYLRTIDDLEPILDRFAPHGRTTMSIVHSAPAPPAASARSAGFWLTQPVALRLFPHMPENFLH